MKNIDKKELIEAARAAMADPETDAFWKEYEERERIQAEHAAGAVKERPLTKS
jgi:hypothetical protein